MIVEEGCFLNILDKLALDIEVLRQEMHSLLEQGKPLTSPEVIIISEKLDKLIDEYNIMKIKLL